MAAQDYHGGFHRYENDPGCFLIGDFPEEWEAITVSLV